ncbi:MAG TPA: ribonuclease H-like domain-containing protein [Methylomirabilota bacterium]|nr:ribonuclease H-like domain-containing protein [Methylomirabilota bacterium]
MKREEKAGRGRALDIRCQGPGARADDVRQVIKLVEARRVYGRPHHQQKTLAELVRGSYQETDFGTVLVASRRFPPSYRHGLLPIGSVLEKPLHPLAAAAGSQSGKELRADRLLYVDTETTGLMMGTGTYAFLIGVGFFDDDGFTLRQYFMEDLDQEPALIAAFDELLPRFDGIVAYNGRAFDFPILETRFILSRRRLPGHIEYLDLLRTSRALWKDHLPDYRLTTIEAEVLGYRREADDLQGWMIPHIYFTWLRQRRPEPIAGVFARNVDDVLSLVALAGWQAALFHDPYSFDLAPPEWSGLGRLWEPFSWERSRACYQEALNAGLKGELWQRLAKRLASIEKRRGNWGEARKFWEECIAADERFDPQPWEELAKHYEHRAKEYTRAREFVLTALDRALECQAREAILARLQHRLTRLNNKCEA